jgi:hypothetical protein
MPTVSLWMEPFVVMPRFEGRYTECGLGLGTRPAYMVSERWRVDLRERSADSNMTKVTYSHFYLRAGTIAELWIWLLL